MATERIALEVSWKLSNLLLHESIPLLGFQDQLQCIDTKLRQTVDSGLMVHPRKSFREIVYDIEEVIDLLVIKASQSKMGTGIFKRFALWVIDLIDWCKFRRKLAEIKNNLFSSYKIHAYRESWWSLPAKDLDVGETIVSPVLEKVIALVGDEHVSQAVRRRARWLRDELISLHGFLKLLQVNGFSEGGEAWMEEVYDALRFLEDVIGLFLYERENFRRIRASLFRTLASGLHYFLSERTLRKEMDQAKMKIKDISGRRRSAIQTRPESGRRRSAIQTRPSLSEGMQGSSSFNSERLEKIPIFDGDIDDIIEMLLRDDQECLTVSIVGTKGTGKTSLAELIYQNQSIVDHFPFRAWVPYANWDILMTQIAGEEYINLKSVIPEHDEFIRRSMEMLNASLMSKKYLIVIDGVSTKTWDKKIGPAFHDLTNANRIIFTSREVGSTPQDDERNFTYRLRLRSDDESWALFTHILNGNIPLKLEVLKREIVRRCGGLPLMIKELGGLVLKKEEGEWSGVLKQLNQEEGPWSITLKEINKNLPLYLRRCLFYFGLFPEDYDIPARRLIGLWVAEGLGRQKEDKESPEFVSEKCLIELVNQNMIQVTKMKRNGKISRCRMPDALRVHWLSKAKEANFLQDNIGVDSPASMGIIRRLADHLDIKDASFDHIHGNNTNSSVCYCYKDVVSFLSFDTREGSRPGEDISKFLDRCISTGSFSYLWVLDLENVYKPKLPKVIGQLTRLRYLGLRSTYLEMLPVFIDKLLNLQTLDLKRTCVNTIPSSIWTMKSLRHLFLDETFRSMLVPRQVESSLIELQTLWGVLIDEGSPVRNGLDTLLKITKLGLRCKASFPSQNAVMSSQLVAVANWVMNLKHVQILRLKSFDESGLPWDLYLESLSEHKDLSSVYLVGKLMSPQLVSRLPQNLIELTLSGSMLVQDPMESLDKLPNIRILGLFSRSFTGNKMLCSRGGFPKLEILKLWELEQLEEWNVEEGSMPCLKDLEIRSCKKLKMIPEGLRHVQTLREVKLTKVPILSSRIKDKQGEDWNIISHARHVMVEDG